MDTKLNINCLTPVDNINISGPFVWTCGNNVIVLGGNPIVIPTLDQLNSDKDDLIQGITELQGAIAAFIETGKCPEVLDSKSTNIHDWLMELVYMYRKLDLIHSMLDWWEIADDEKIAENRLRTVVENHNQLNASIETKDLFQCLSHITDTKLIDIKLKEVADGTTN